MPIHGSRIASPTTERTTAEMTAARPYNPLTVTDVDRERFLLLVPPRRFVAHSWIGARTTVQISYFRGRSLRGIGLPLLRTSTLYTSPAAFRPPDPYEAGTH